MEITIKYNKNCKGKLATRYCGVNKVVEHGMIIEFIREPPVDNRIVQKEIVKEIQIKP